MTNLWNQPIDDLELRMMEQARKNRGRVPLDFTNDLHYQYCLDRLGGKKQIERLAPALFAQLQAQNNPAFKAGEYQDTLPSITLEDYEKITNVEAKLISTPKASEDGSAVSAQRKFRIAGTPEASYSTRPVSDLYIQTRIMDCDTGRYIYQSDSYPLPDENHVFSQAVDTLVPEYPGVRDHAYVTSAFFLAGVSMKDDCALLAGTYVSSITYTVSSTEDIKAIKVIDPVIKNAGIRPAHKEEICISYKRDANIGSPDYSYKVNLPQKIQQMPVTVPLTLTVELQNDAYFKPTKNGSYFTEDWDPDICLCRFNNENKKPISAGSAPLLQDWATFSRDHIDVYYDQNKHATKLQLNFPEEWKANLKATELLNTSTYTCLDANISFNTCNKDAGGTYREMPTSVFIRYDKTLDQKNPSDPGVNSMYLPLLYYQWGCLGADTKMSSSDGMLEAKDVRIGDILITGEGNKATVRNIYSGTEQKILHIVHEKGEIFLTEDHTLFNAKNRPVLAGSVKPGDMLLYQNQETRQQEAVQVKHRETIPYSGKVYNFCFDTKTTLVGNNLIVGDYAWQQTVRPPVKEFKAPKANQAVNSLFAQLRELTDAPKPIKPVFSTKAECLPLHFYALKALASYDNMYTEVEAQTIAEYCQYLADNATTGGIPVNSIPQALDEAGICSTYLDKGEAQYIVPIIPTAMKNWYDDNELNEKKPWLQPPYKEELDRTYDMIDDVLAPFHYPVDKNMDYTTFDSAYLEELLDATQIKAKAEGGQISRQVMMQMGVVLHLLADSMLHEQFRAKRTWANLGRIDHILDPKGNDIIDKFPPYKDYEYKAYKKGAPYPAGIQQNGAVSGCPYARYSYKMPRSTQELPKINGQSQYGKHKTADNTPRYVTVCKRILEFLSACKNRHFDQLTWNNILAPSLGEAFSHQAETDADLKTYWESAFPNTKFDYNANTVYERLINGKPGAENDLEKYEEFFQFTMLLNNLKEGEIVYGK